VLVCALFFELFSSLLKNLSSWVMRTTLHV
jgi:hypothetical protein